jgi:hypothetical protein
MGTVQVAPSLTRQEAGIEFMQNWTLFRKTVSRKIVYLL